ncbi:MAG: AraC family transcriptional regulator [Chthoniobacteraceae bacterium]
MNSGAETPDTPAVSHEAAAWESVRPGWRQLYGDFHNQGVSIEEHDFRATKTLDWASSFHPESIEVCLNLAGRGEVIAGKQRADFTERTVGHYAMVKRKLSGSRWEGDRHQFVTVELSRAFVLQNFHGSEEKLLPSVQSFMEGRPNGAVSPVISLSSAHEALIVGLRNPPVNMSARTIWYQAKVLELISQLFFDTAGPELFCSRQKRMARERTEAVMILLRNRLQDPPTLNELAKQIGCSPFHLSRNFSEQNGMTIPQYLRQVRMERAAELLRSGSYNVTEVAFTVGYSSLGHFSKSFCEEIGCCPSLYPQALSVLGKGKPVNVPKV